MPCLCSIQYSVFRIQYFVIAYMRWNGCGFNIQTKPRAYDQGLNSWTGCTMLKKVANTKVVYWGLNIWLVFTLGLATKMRSFLLLQRDQVEGQQTREFRIVNALSTIQTIEKLSKELSKELSAELSTELSTELRKNLTELRKNLTELKNFGKKWMDSMLNWKNVWI